MTVKIFIDLGTQPFVADLVFPNGMPEGGYVTLFVGCCQRTPQPGKQIDHISLDEGSSSAVPVVRKTCHNQTYTEFCDGKIYVRNGSSAGAGYSCSLRHSCESHVLTGQEHRRLHIQREVPELCGDITPIHKSPECYHCPHCSFTSSSRDQRTVHENSHGGALQSCILCKQAFKSRRTLNQHMCLHILHKPRCTVCNVVFLSEEQYNLHMQRDACRPAAAAAEIVPSLRAIKPPPPPSPPPPRTPTPQPAGSDSVASSSPPPPLPPPPASDGSASTAGDAPAASSGCWPYAIIKKFKKDPLLATLPPRRPRIPCPHCPRFCFSNGALQIHLRRKHISNAPLKCPHCPKRFFLDTLFYKHRSICARKKKDLKPLVKETRNRWNRLTCEHCNFYSHRYKQLTDHYAAEHPEHTLSTCEKCGARFAHFAYMLLHQVQVHLMVEDHQLHKCSLCDVALEGVEALKNHLLEVHAPALLHKCIECFERFSSEAVLLQHRDEKHNPNSVNCPDCPKTFKNAMACRRHVLYTHLTSRLVNSCKYCFRRYKDMLTLRYHMAISHMNVLTDEEKASLEPLRKHCSQCSYKTFNRRCMVGHMRRKHGGMIQCDECPSRFAQVAELTRHKRLRHGPVGVQDCPHCPRSFVCPKTYQVHLTMHQEGHGHTCPICGRLFESEAMLNNHNESHRNPGNRRCAACLQLFASSKYLAKHQKAHSEEGPDGTLTLTCTSAKMPANQRAPARSKDQRPFGLSCDECHLRFKYQSSLTAHKMTAHGGKPKGSKSSLTCEICERSFVSVLGLSSHLRIHTGERPFACQECGAAFCQASTLREHTVLKHSRAFRETCPLCGRGCVTKTKLRKHLQAAHKATLVCAQPAAPRRSPGGASTSPARAGQLATPSQVDSTPTTYLLPDLSGTQEYGGEEGGEMVGLPADAQLVEGSVPQVLAVTSPDGGPNLAVAVDSIINLMVCDTLIETSCIELASEEVATGQ
ncbi:uncharacterized protein LOC144174005 isoform X2 [Haemaphysalis longicornis]